MRNGRVLLRIGMASCLLMAALFTSRVFAAPLCTVSIASSSAGQTLVSPVNITITGTILCSPVDGVQIKDNNQGLFLIDVGQMQGSGFSYSFSQTWTNVPVGVHRLTGQALGGSATSDTITVTVLAPATSSLSASPNPCNIPSGSTTCTASIAWSSNRSATGVWVTGLDNSNPQQFLGSGGQLSGSQTATWITSGGARFHLKENAASPDLATVDVRGNPPPSVSWSVSPLSGGIYVAPANIPLGAYASDPGGSVQRVEFWLDGVLKTSTTAAPYQTTISSLAAGSHSVQAIAYDNLGNKGATSATSFTVKTSVVTGNVDGISSSGVISGWACSSYLAQSINVDVYAGGPAGSGTAIGRFLANQASEPAVAAACGVSSGSYRYQIALSEAQRAQFSGKSIYVHGISPNGGNNLLLTGSGNFSLPVFVRNAQFVGQTVSSSMITGHTQSVSVQMRNNGSYTWSASTNFRLGAQNPADNATWGLSYPALSADVAPGQTAMFTFTITAPATPGTHNFQWQMQQAGVAWFGDLTPNVSITVSAPPPVVSVTSSVDYDELGRVITRRDSAGAVKVSYTYDDNGNVVKVTDALGHVTAMTYDALDRVSTSTDASGHIASYQYDIGDRLTQVTDPRGLVTGYTYDGFGQLWKQVSPDTGTTAFTYDAYGRRSSMTRADGVLTTYGYDSLNRLTSISAGGQTQNATYDNCTNGVGRLCRASDANGTTSYSYTPDGQIAGRGFSIGGTTYALGYSYDSIGRVASVVYPDGNSVAYSYTHGRISAATVTVSGNLESFASAVTYRPGDPTMASWTSHNGLTNTLAYDTDGRLTGISVPGVQNLAFNYDSVDRINKITNGIDSTLTQAFGYDPMSRLNSVISTADNESFQYDANGNRISQVGNGTSTLSTVSATSNRLSNFGVHAYGYDANGNTTLVNGESRYHYDAFNRMDSAAGTSYYVNPEGQRLRKSGGAGTSYFAPDGSGGMLAESSGTGWVDYVWLNGRLIGRVAGGHRFAIHTDQVGRPEAVTDSSKAVVWRAQNFAFTQNVTTAAITLNLGFPGQYYDAETSAWNNGYRDYKEALGRYVESDPIGLNGGINTYAYVGNNPLSYTDPFGLKVGTIGISGTIGAMWGITGGAGLVFDGSGNVGMYNYSGEGFAYGASLAAAGSFMGSLGADTTTIDDFGGPFGNLNIPYVDGYFDPNNPDHVGVGSNYGPGASFYVGCTNTNVTKIGNVNKLDLMDYVAGKIFGGQWPELPKW